MYRKESSSANQCPCDEKCALESLANVQGVLKEVKEVLGDSGRILLRYSGTENICRVMVEGTKSIKWTPLLRQLLML